MPCQRNYKAEYQRRLASAAKRGLSRSQARGHAKAGEASALASSKALENALKLYRQTGNRAAAAKEHGIAPERFSRFLTHAVTVKGRGKSLKIQDDRPREMLVISNGEARPVVLRGYDQASLNGKYLSAVNACCGAMKRRVPPSSPQATNPPPAFSSLNGQCRARSPHSCRMARGI